MLIYDPGVPESKLDALTKAVAAIRNRLSDPKLPSDLRCSLTLLIDEEEVQALRPVPTRSHGVVIAYDAGEGNIGAGPYAYTTGPCVWICERSFAAGQARLEAVLCHELVHVACGWELDSEAFERALFPGAATDPDTGDWESFRQQNWMGRWVYMRKQGNEAAVKTHETHTEVCRFNIPPNVVVP
jgi:hypothetical protein